MKVLFLLLLSLLITFNNVFSDEIVVTEIPLSATNPDSVMTFSWLKMTKDNIFVDSSKISLKYSKVSGAYTDSISAKYLKAGDFVNSYSFKASEYLNSTGGRILKTGQYYAIFDYKFLGTHIFSKEFIFIVESDQPVVKIGPESSSNNGIKESVPTFLWEANSGVPYYHIFLSDEPISISEDQTSVSGISAIWQAITPKTSIQYGAVDPSGEFSDIEAPPLMPGIEYNWIVLNNYGNSVVTSSTVMGLPSTFSIAATSNIKAPKNLYPTNTLKLNSTANPNIEFKWNSGGKDVNLYEVYLFVSDSISGVEAKVNVWKGTTTDTVLTFNALQTLYNKTYFWKVYALDEAGVGKVSPLTSFDYKINVSWLNIRTKDSDGNDLSFVNLKAEPIEGSADVIPYSSNKDGSGGTRQFLLGTYKIMASKDGYLDNSIIADLTMADDTTYETINLQPAPASIYGYVLAVKDRKGIGSADVVAINGNETISTKSDANGYYSLDLNSYGQWTISTSKKEYEFIKPENVEVKSGEKKLAPTLFLKKSIYSIFGTISNKTGSPIARANVEVYKSGTEEPYISATTPDNGFYTFNVPYGDWEVNANFPGFATKTKVIDGLAEKNQIDFTLVKGGQINGTIFKKEFIKDKDAYGSIAQLSNATVGIVSLSAGDTTYILTDAYGKYSIGVAYGDYKIFAKKSGFISSSLVSNVNVNSVNRTYIGADVTLTTLASIKGFVYSSLDSSVIRDVSIVLRNSGGVFSNVVTDKDGKYSITNVADGSYTLSVAKKGYNLTSSKDVVVTSGVLRGNYDFYITKGDVHTLKYKTNYHGEVYTSGSFGLSYPFKEVGEGSGGTYLIDSLTSGEYQYYANSGNSLILDIVQSKVQINLSDADTLSIANEFFFTTSVSDTFNTNSNVVSYTVSSAENRGDMYLFYRKVGDANYVSKLMNFSGDRYTLSDSLTSTGYLLDYFFELEDKSTNTVYSNRNRPYYTFVKLISKLEYVKWNPSLPDTLSSKVVLINTPFSIGVDGYNRGIKNNSLIASITWRSSDSNIVSFKSKITKGDEQNLVYPMSSGIAVISAQVIGVRGNIVTEYAKLEVFDGVIDSAYIVRTDISPDDYKLENTETASFAIKAKIKKKDNSTATINLLSQLQTTPSRGVVLDGLNLHVADDFVGQLEISSRVKNYGDVYYHQSENIREGKRHLNVVSKVVEGDTITNYRNLSIYFPKGSFETGEEDMLSLSKEVFTTNQKIIGKYEAIDDIYNVRMDHNSSFLKPVEMIYNVKDEYRDRGSFVLSYYNDSLLEFVVVDTVDNLTNDSIAKFTTTHFSTYAIMGEREPISIKNVVFSPNPFSPYVYARDNEKKYPGLGIKFFSSSQVDDVPTIKIEIFTMSGVRIWSENSSGNVQAGNQEFNWDGRESVTGKMSPNGRYIVKITASEEKTGKEVIYKGIVVLIK